MQKAASAQKSGSTYQWAVRVGKNHKKARRRMFGIEICVTCGDLTLLSRNPGYNESDAASEVS